MNLPSAQATVGSSISINDVSLNEGNAGPTSFTFTVSYNETTTHNDVTFDIMTVDGSAQAGSDYVAKTLTGQVIHSAATLRSAAAGVLPATYTFTVLVNGDGAFEPDENFTVILTNVVGAAVADGVGLGTILNDDIAPVVVADLALTISSTVTGTTAPANSVAVGDTITYTYALTNKGPDAAPTTLVTLPIPANTVLVSASQLTGPAFTQASVGLPVTSVSYSTASFATGIAATFQLVVRVNQGVGSGVTITDNASATTTATNPGGNDTPSKALTTVINSDVSVTVSDSPDPVEAGHNLTYAITVANNGPTAATGVAFGDTMPSGTKFVSMSQISGPAFTLTTPAVNGNGPISGTLASMSAGNSAAFALVVKVPFTLGTLTNMVTTTSTSSDLTGGNNSDKATTTVICPTIKLSPESPLAVGTVGYGYNQSVTAGGGLAPYSYAMTSGNLPGGLTMSTNGVISGTATNTGLFSFTVTATDANGCTGSDSYNIEVICPEINFVRNLPQNEQIAPEIPDAVIDMSYPIQTLVASGGTAPYTYAVIIGALPPKMKLSSGGVISGTPTNFGFYTFTVLATDFYGCTGSHEYTLSVVCPEITVSPETLLDGQSGAAYFQKITASGGIPPYHYTASGTLPGGLKLSSGGIFSGTLSNSGTFEFSVTATDENGCTGSREYAVSVAAADVLPDLTLITNGVGSIRAIPSRTGTPTNGAPLVTGNAYIVIATPGENSIFKDWTITIAGETTIAGDDVRCIFVMQPNLVLTANFVTNRMAGVAGNYYGLFQDPEDEQPSELSAGYFRVRVVTVRNQKARFSGTLYFDNHYAGFAGGFDVDGSGYPTKFTFNNQTLTVTLHLNFDDTIGGTIVSSAGWMAEMDGDHAVFGGESPQNIYSGKYTMLMSGTAGLQGTAVYGLGCAAFSIDNSSGMINGYSQKPFGYFGDGESLTPIRTPVSKSGRWPFFARKHQPSTGALMGWVQFDGDGGILDYESTINWIKASGTDWVDVQGSGYNASGMELTNATAILANGNLVVPSANDVVIAGGSSIMVNPVNTAGYPNRLRLNLDLNTGFVNGLFVSPVNPGRFTPVRGVYLQDQNYSGGFFLGPTKSGSFLLGN